MITFHAARVRTGDPPWPESEMLWRGVWSDDYGFALGRTSETYRTPELAVAHARAEAAMKRSGAR